MAYADHGSTLVRTVGRLCFTARVLLDVHFGVFVQSLSLGNSTVVAAARNDLQLVETWGRLSQVLVVQPLELHVGAEKSHIRHEVDPRIQLECSGELLRYRAGPYSIHPSKQASVLHGRHIGAVRARTESERPGHPRNHSESPAKYHLLDGLGPH